MKPKRKRMWAVRWLDYDGSSNPEPWITGAWAIAPTKSLADKWRVSHHQKIDRVMVTIEPIKRKKSK